MDLITPNLGLVFWMTLCFLIILFILRKFAWKPIMKTLKDREDKIEQSLRQAEKAHAEMKQLKFSNEQLLKEAKEERDSLLNDARAIKEKIIEDARVKANEEADRIVQAAKDSIHYEKMEALTELKNQVALLSVDIAEKLIQQELSKDNKQQDFIDKLLKDISFN